MNGLGYSFLRYLNLGFSVVPIKTTAYLVADTRSEKAAKAPLVTWKPYQQRRATRQETDYWSRHWPRAGAAVVCGLLSDVMVLDDDLGGRPPVTDQTTQLYKAGNDLQAALMELPTARARSAKGRHFYFRMPRNVDGTPRAIGNKVGFLPGWDLRGEGGYVILPPTVHPSGVRYEWERDPEDGILEAPAWVIKTLEELKAPFESTPAPGGGSVWKINTPVPEGRRNDALAQWIGAQIGKGGPMHDELAWPLLQDAIVGHNALCNNPPLPLDEVRTILESICARERDARAAVAAEQEAQLPDTPIELRTAAELGVMTLHAPDYAIRDLIVDGTTQLFGKPKSGKSWLGFQVAAAVGVPGRPLFPSTAAMYAFANHPQGFDAHHGDVLYLALEDGWLRLQNRGKEIFHTTDIDKWPNAITFAIEWDPCFDGGLLRIERWLRDHPAARLVVIDTIAAFMGIGTQDRGSVFRAEYRMFRPIFELGQRFKVPILVVDHASKGKGKAGSNDPYDSGAGTLGSQACVDSVMILEHDEKGPYARLHHKGRDIERGFIDLEHTTKSPLWKIRTTFDELKAAREGKKAVLEA